VILFQNQENQLRAAKKEPPLPEEDLNKIFKPIPVPLRLTPMLMASQIDAYGEHISKFCSQSLAKLFIMQATKNK
jgi:translation initiation factor 3 subunit H